MYDLIHIMCFVFLYFSHRIIQLSDIFGVSDAEKDPTLLTIHYVSKTPKFIWKHCTLTLKGAAQEEKEPWARSIREYIANPSK